VPKARGGDGWRQAESQTAREAAHDARWHESGRTPLLHVSKRFIDKCEDGDEAYKARSSSRSGRHDFASPIAPACSVPRQTIPSVRASLVGSTSRQRSSRAFQVKMP